MKIRTLALNSLALTTLIMLSACGGGGSDSGTVAATVSFPLLAGNAARIISGASDRFTISGTCTGTGSTTTSKPISSNFEGVTGYSVGQTANLTLTNCTPASNTISATTYFDSTYTLLGVDIPNTRYEKFATQPPPPLPTSVKVGDTAVYATLTLYTNSTKSVVTGQHVLSYVVETDTSSTALITLITKEYNTSNQLTLTQLAKYRIGADGTLSVLSIDQQGSLTNTTHLVWTKV